MALRAPGLHLRRIDVVLITVHLARSDVVRALGMLSGYRVAVFFTPTDEPDQAPHGYA